MSRVIIYIFNLLVCWGYSVGRPIVTGEQKTMTTKVTNSPTNSYEKWMNGDGDHLKWLRKTIEMMFTHSEATIAHNTMSFVSNRQLEWLATSRHDAQTILDKNLFRLRLSFVYDEHDFWFITHRHNQLLWFLLFASCNIFRLVGSSNDDEDDCHLDQSNNNNSHSDSTHKIKHILFIAFGILFRFEHCRIVAVTQSEIREILSTKYARSWFVSVSFPKVYSVRYEENTSNVSQNAILSTVL